MKKIFGLISLFSCALLLTSCGGGGGGGGGGSSSSASEGVRLLHAGIDQSPVELLIPSSTSQQVLQRAFFSEETGFTKLSKGDISVSLRRTSDGKILGNELISYSSGKQVDILVAQNISGEPVIRSFLRDRPSPGNGCVRVVNGIQGSSGIQLLANGAPLGTPVQFFQAGEYLEYGDGTILSLRSGGEVRTVGELSTSSCYTLFAAGQQGYFWLTRVLPD